MSPQTINPDTIHRSPAIESLEVRALLSGVPTSPISTVAITPLVSLARRLVNETAMENNLYDTPTVISWAGINGATVTKNTSVCSTLVTALLKQAYGYKSADIANWTGETSPEAEDYYDAAVAGTGLAKLNNIANVRIGDVFVAKYVVPPVGSTATGHIAIVDRLPTLLSTTSTTRTYALPVIDSSSSYHGFADTRYRIDPTTGVEDDGVGFGTMRMKTDLNGALIEYSWSTLSGSTYYDDTERPALFARLPGKTLKAGSPAARNSIEQPVVNEPESPFENDGDLLGL